MKADPVLFAKAIADKGSAIELKAISRYDVYKAVYSAKITADEHH